MRTLKIAICSILFFYATQATAQYDSLFAVVSGDTVTLWQTGAYRNCGAAYRMEIEQSDYEIIWYQIDTGSAAYCFCYFDLSVSFQISESGTYHADIYYTESIDPGSPIFDGSIYFSVGNSYGPIRSEIISQYQSNCYQNVGITEKGISRNTFNVYPIPLRDGELLNIEAFPTGGKAVFEIFTLTGKLVYSKQYDGNRPIQGRWVKDELFPVSGLYFVRWRTPDQIFVRKINVL